MEPPTSLSDFLASREAEGRFFDTAEFTLDSLRAREKLGQYQLENSGFWLVKVVQAAVAGGADGVRITFGRKLVTVVFQNRPGWNADELLESVLSGRLPSDPALLHIVTGLRACSSSINETVSWSAGDSRVSLSQTGTRVEQRRPGVDFELVVARPSRNRSVRHTLTSSVTQLVKQTVEEYDAVRSRCWVSPIPIQLDGRPLERSLGSLQGAAIERNPLQVLLKHERSRSSIVHACLGERRLRGLEGTPEFRVPEVPEMGPEETYEVRQPVHRGQTFLTWNWTGDRCQAAVALISEHGAQSSVELVLDGAVVESRPLDWEIKAKSLLPVKPNMGIRFVFGVSTEQLDLSQFGVREFDEESLIAQLLGPTRELCQACLDNLSKLYYIPVGSRFSKPLGAALGVHAATITAITKGLFVLPLAGVVGVNLAIWRRQVSTGLKGLEEFLASRSPEPL